MAGDAKKDSGVLNSGPSGESAQREGGDVAQKPAAQMPEMAAALKDGEKAAQAKSPDQDVASRKGQCPACTLADAHIYNCHECHKEFCDKCQGKHAPPDKKSFESTVTYMYRLKGSMDWKQDMLRFEENAPAMLCPACYEAQCNKAIWRLKWRIKNWHTEILRNEDVRLVDQTMPTCEIPERKVVAAAKVLLNKLNDGKEINVNV